MKKNLLLIVIPIVLLTGCYSQTQLSSNDSAKTEEQNKEQQIYQNFVNIKYRDDPVDIANERFEALDTSKSSVVRGAWYDVDNNYMVINLNGTYYHYCGMPIIAWTSLKSADSFGSHYNKYIKGSYDCRNNYVPDY